MITNFPRHIPFNLNRASLNERQRLNMTCDHFKINEQKQRQLLSEVILRLGLYFNTATMCWLPVDEKGKMLYSMYKYFDSLSYANN